ncbi:MAG: DUF4190 domain-containing protein [Bacteroidetes bacterium]|nr:DUF4190 domain-containing protein [Bacteroidota bacterium]
MKSSCFISSMLLISSLLFSPIQAECAISTASRSNQTVFQNATASDRWEVNHSYLIKKKHKKNIQDGPKDDPLAILALAAGIASVVGILQLLAFITAPIGIILSIASLNRIKKNPDKWKGRNKAIWGLVLSILGLAFSIGFFVYLVNNIFD